MEKVLSYKTLSFHIDTTAGYAFSPAMKKRLHTALVKICTTGGDSLSHSCDDGDVRKT
jgi:hypothetical protein